MSEGVRYTQHMLLEGNVTGRPKTRQSKATGDNREEKQSGGEGSGRGSTGPGQSVRLWPAHLISGPVLYSSSEHIKSYVPCLPP